jgi:hypothetical protein
MGEPALDRRGAAKDVQLSCLLDGIPFPGAVRKPQSLFWTRNPGAALRFLGSHARSREGISFSASLSVSAQTTEAPTIVLGCLNLADGWKFSR